MWADVIKPFDINADNIIWLLLFEEWLLVSDFSVNIYTFIRNIIVSDQKF